MKILIVSYFDDNFGDMLIKTCFEGLLKVVLKNCGKDNYSLFNMPLKEIDEDKIKKSDIVFFAGGGLIGNSYLDFYKYVKDILDICTNFNIPVYLSSVGINNMDNRSNEINSDLQELLNRNNYFHHHNLLTVRNNFVSIHLTVLCLNHKLS